MFSADLVERLWRQYICQYHVLGALQQGSLPQFPKKLFIPHASALSFFALHLFSLHSSKYPRSSPRITVLFRTVLTVHICFQIYSTSMWRMELFFHRLEPVSCEERELRFRSRAQVEQRGRIYTPIESLPNCANCHFFPFSVYTPSNANSYGAYFVPTQTHPIYANIFFHTL